MSATIEEITRLIDDGYTVTIKSAAGIVSVKVETEGGKIVSSGRQPSLVGAVDAACNATPGKQQAGGRAR